MKHLKLFFALFAMLALGVGNAWAQTVTWEKATSIAAGDVVALVCESKKMELSGISTTSTKYGTGVAYTSAPVGKYELTVEAGSSSGTFSFKNGSDYLYWSSGNSLNKTTTKNANASWKVTFSSGNATILNAKDNTRKLQWNASSPRFACYTGAQTAVQLYKKVISDEPADVIVKTLKSIAVEGATTDYETGDMFKFDGTCTATYGVTKNDVEQEDETKVVTPTSVSTPDMSTAGVKEVTVTYTEDEVTVTDTYTITVTENVITAGEYELALNNTFFGCGTGNIETEQVKKSNDILVTAGCLSSASSKTYYHANHVRFYAASYLKLSVPEGYVINSIIFTADGTWNGSITVDAGTYTDDAKTWAGSAQEVVFSFGQQNRIATATVTYAAAGETPDPTPDPEEPEEPVVPEVPENLGAKTIAEFLELKNTTDTCVLTGVVANIANTEYGNFDLVDATGSVYVYGLLTAAGEGKQFASMNIAAGDTLTVKAIYNEYNGNPQAKNAIYVSHTKAAAPIVPENLGAKTIAEFLELKNTTDTCVLTGVVANIVNTTYGNFDLVDATGSVYVYGLLTAAGESKQFASMDIAAGDTLTVKAIYNEFNSKAQAKNAIYVSHSKLVLTVEVTSENGTVDGLVDGGKYVRGTEATLTATANDHYVFVNWTKGEEVVSTENPYTFNVTADVALVANFKLDTHTVTATAVNGTVTGLVEGGIYEHGAEATLTATPAEGYEFVNWTENEVEVSTDAEYTFEVLADYNLVANFEKLTYTVTANATNGTVTGAGTYNHGEEVTLTATPAFDYEFVNWTVGEETITENPLTITVAEDVTLKAIFAEVAATEKKESGVFSISAHKTATFATGNLQHNVGTGEWRFAKQQYQVVGEQNIQLGHPDFTGWIDMLGYSADGKYGVNPSNANADYAEEFVDWGTLFPEEGWSTLSKEDWKYLLEERTNAAKLQQVAKVGDILGIMLFPDNWTLPEGCTPTEGTNHDPDDGEETKYDFTTQNYTLEQWTKLEEAGALFLPAAGRRTGGWGNTTLSENVPGGVLDADGHYKHFDNCNEYAYYWTSTKVGENVNYLINCRLVDKPNDIYSVGAAHVDWAEKGRYGQSVRLAKVAYDKHTVTATAENGTVTGAGTYEHGKEVTLTATAAEGYKFVNWTENEVEVSTAAEYTFEVLADHNLVANFEKLTYTVTATATNGTVEGLAADGKYEHGAEATLAATANEGYEFVNWTSDKTVVSTENPYKFTVTADVDLVANFKEKEVAPTKLYLTPNANWKQSNARFAAYFFGNGETWVSMTKVAGETDLYEVTIPTDKKYPNVIFCRMNPSASANNWNDGVKWNQTADLVIPTDGKNHYTVKEGTWDKGGGTWSIWPVPTVKTYVDITITVIANAPASIKWANAGDKLADATEYVAMTAGENNTYTYTLAQVDEAKGVDYTIKVGDIVSTTKNTSKNVTVDFKNLLPQVAIEGIDGKWDSSNKMTVSDDYLTASITLPLAAKDHAWKLTIDAAWLGGSKFVITRTNNSVVVKEDAGGDGKLTADIAGDYVFTWTYASQTLTVAYPVSVTATAENGIVEGAGTYTHGTEVTLTATPAEGYEFVNWTIAGEEVEDEATYTFVAEANVDLVANFKKHETTINIEPGNGKLSGAIATAFPGDTIILADGEYTEKWSFALNKAGVIVKAAEGAKPVIKASSYMQHYATITFIGITFDGQNTAEYTVYSYENTSKNLTFKDCEFTGYTYYNICQSSSSHVDSLIIDNCLFKDNGYATVYYTNPASGVITCSYAKITNTTIYNVGDPNHETGIIDIREGVAGANENEIIIDHVTIYNFMNPAGFGAIMPYKSGNVVVSNSIVMNPEATNSYAFRVYNGVKIQNTLYYNCKPKTDGGAIYTNCLNVDPLFVDAANGNFALMPLSPARGAATNDSDLGDPRWYTSVNKYTVTATANPAEAGTVSGAGEYIEGVEVTLVATPERGYSFVNWTIEGEEVSTEATYTFTPSANIELVANFEEIEFTGNIINVEPGKGTLATAVENAEAGDKIVLADGIYTQEHLIAINKAGLIITAAEGAKPVIALTGEWTALNVSASTTFDGITFDGTNVAKYIIATLDATAMTTDLAIYNCEFKNWTLWAISNQYEKNVSVNSVVIDNCLFHDATGAAIRFSEKAPEGKHACEYLKVTNTTIYNIVETSYAGIIQASSNNEATDDQNKVLIDHVTIANFDARQLGALVFRKTENIQISNSIIVGKEDSTHYAVHMYEGKADNVLYYNSKLRTDKAGVYTKCYNTDPMFTHPEHGIFCLQEGSPAIGAATDGTNLGDPRWNTPHYLVELSVLNPDHGTVEGAGVYKEGETVTVVAYAKPDYKFAAWIDNNDVNEEVTDRIYSFEITGDVNLQAEFEYEEGAQGDATDIENNIISNSQVMKVIQNGRLFIIREGKIYNAQGQVVK